MSGDLELHGILSHQIDCVWHHVLPMLEKSLGYADGKYSAEKILGFLLSKQMQLWIAIRAGSPEIRAFAITEIIHYPEKKVMLIMFASGKKSCEWIHFIEELKGFAQHHDCRSIEIYGRKGWERKLRPFGYVKIHYVYRLELGAE